MSQSDLTCALTEQGKNSRNNNTLHSLKIIIVSYAFLVSNVCLKYIYIYTIGTDTIYKVTVAC